MFVTKDLSENWVGKGYFILDIFSMMICFLFL